MGSVDVENEKERHIYIDSIIITALAIAKGLYLHCEYPIEGDTSKGYGDYVVLKRSSGAIICVREAKKSDMPKAMAQLTPELISALQVWQIICKFFQIE